MDRFNKVLALLCLSLFPAAVFALDVNNPLPNWIDPARERIDKRPPVTVPRQAPPSDFRIPAEYEPVAAVVISWGGYSDMLASIARAVTGPGKARIWAVSAPASLSGVPAESYSVVRAPIDTVWVRDYGPFGISAKRGKVGIVDAVYRHYQYRRNDDALPVNLGKAKSIEVFGMPIVLDGGNVMVNSKGDLFMTKRTYLWNPRLSPGEVDDALKEHFKVKNVYTFEYAGYPGNPADGTGHIDMFMKLLNDHTVLITTAETEPFKSNSEKAMAFFRNKIAPDGQPYRVITVPGWEDYGTWYTYTNSLIVNKAVLIPSYNGHSQEEARARAAYENGIPGVTVVPINSENSIGAGGSIHCVTQTIPVVSGNKEAPVTAPAVQGVTDTTLGQTADIRPDHGYPAFLQLMERNR